MNLDQIWAGDKQAIRLAMGELTPQEMRNILALLNLLRPEREEWRKKLRLQALQLLSLQDQDWGLEDDPAEVKFRKRIKQLEAEVADLKQKQGAKNNDVSGTGREGDSVGDGPEDHPQQQSDGATHEDDVRVGRIGRRDS